MENLFESFRHVLLHPLALTGLLATLGCLGVLGFRIRKLGEIIQALRALPAQKRRYTLEREYGFHPGPDNLPIEFVRQKRRQAVLFVVVCTMGFSGALASAVVDKAVQDQTIVWELDDSRLTPERLGYTWELVLTNQSDRAVRVETAHLDVIRKSRHPDRDRILTDHPESPHTANYRAVLRPSDLSVPVIGADSGYLLGPREERVLRVVLEAEHPANEGWTYDVQFVLRWSGPDRAEVFTTRGGIYRIGWPGLCPPSEAEPPESPEVRPLTDPATRISR